LQLLNFTVVASGLFLLTGFLHQRLGSTDFVALGGVAQRMPLFTALFFLFALASIGIPGTNGFPAEFLLLLSVLHSHTGAGIAALLGVVLSAAYTLSFYRRALLGPIKNDGVASLIDLRRRELLIMMALAFCILLVGLYPALLLDMIQPVGTAWLQGL
ncbi:proton-conducting transporter transmembrane domain-containing protein, partial [Candidatus Venteria ishoeyi]|uniref:proton-conducting transporter transmembrane domain-containing protein n=1 Tax=Candidatus Venteria ishoeyi TaxID=1899563 RepID=UPI00255C9888